tara:strand:+ start:414 stop:740 length:327 start_codon:yes stop_codon:yes gene_type:complete
MKITKSQLKQIIKEELEEAQETSYNGKKIVVLFTEVQNKMNELAGELKKLPDDRGYPAKRGPRIAPDVDPGTVDGGMIALYVDLVRTTQVREIGRRINKILDALSKKK